MQRRDWINIGLTAAQAVAAIAIVFLTIALWRVNARLAKFQELDIRSRAETRLEIVRAAHDFTPKIEEKPGERRALLFFHIRNTSGWPITNPRIEYKHWDTVRWGSKVPKGEPGQIKKGIVKGTKKAIGIVVRPDENIFNIMEGDGKLVTTIEPDEILLMGISADTAANPEGRILEDNKHLPFGIRLIWSGPFGKQEKKVQYIDIHREASPISAKPKPYITTDIFDRPPEHIPDAFLKTF